MPSPMPEFEMPSAPPRASATVESEVEPGLESGSERPEPRNDPPDDDRSVDAARRRRLVVGAVLAAAVVAVALAVGIAQAVQRHAHTLAIEAVTAAAVDYLTAIAEGRGDDASALVPVVGDAPLLTDAALADAERIDRFGVGSVELDGDAAIVEVSYRAGQRSAERRLQAERVEDSWRITTSLAEPVRLDASQFLSLPSYLGVEIGGDRATLLYPGVYAADPVEHPLVTFAPLAIVVDGDPSTAAMPRAPLWRVAEGVVESARARALSHALACGDSAACPIAGSEMVLGDSSSIALVADGAVEFDVPLQALSGPSGAPSQLWVAVQASSSAAGGIDWQCSDPVGLDSSGGVPVERTWNACA